MEKVLNNSFFVSNTPILTEKGYINIKDLNLEMKVLNSDNEYCNILEIQKNEKSEIMEIQTMDGEVFEATPNQFFLVSQKKKGIYTVPQRKMLKSLNKEDYLISHYEKDGSGHIYYQYTSVKSKRMLETKKESFNLIVEGNHTYIANDKLVCDNSMMVRI